MSWKVPLRWNMVTGGTNMVTTNMVTTNMVMTGVARDSAAAA
jgi:hypothetical protein